VLFILARRHDAALAGDEVVGGVLLKLVAVGTLETANGSIADE
jgi:hypothetical protein